MKRTKLGEILLDRGALSAIQLQEALEQQHASEGRRLGELVVDLGYATDEMVAHGLADQFQLQYVDPMETAIDRDVMFLVPRTQAVKQKVLALRRTPEGVILVAMVNPQDLSLLNELQFQLKGTVRPVITAPSRIKLAIDRNYGLESQARRVLKGMAPQTSRRVLRPASLALDGAAIEKRLKQGGQKPYEDLVSLMLMHGIEQDASDIHLEPQRDGLRVRARIDGMLQEMMKLPLWTVSPLVTRIKVIGELDVANRLKPQDGKVSVSLEDRRVDLRISVVPSQFGENVVIRILDPAMLQCDLSELGWHANALTAFYRMVSRPRGMVLCVGPTGSGKTTTLYSTIHRLRSEATSIVTVEDPIEYTVEGIVQFEVEHRAQMTFASIIPALLRQDPNVIVIGEIRDAETAKAAIQATTTGHLVLSTLHTTQTTSTIVRMLELGITPHLLGDCLSGIVAQRLVRRVCSECSVIAQPQEEDWRRLGLQPRAVGGDTRRVGPGCPACLYTGYRGRVGVFEVLRINDAVRSLIQARASEQTLWSQARTDGMETLFEDALRKVSQGISTFEELARVVPVDPWRQDGGAPAADRRTAAVDRRRLPPPSEEVLDPPSSGEVVLTLLEEPTEETAAEPEPPRPIEEVAGLKQDAPDEEADGGPIAEGMQPQEAREPVVLVVDDAEEILQLVRITLEDSYTVEVARDGVEALELIDQLHPDLLVLDVMMPKMGGYAVCETIKSDPETADLPIIILSARGEKAHLKKGLRLGADDYLPKPFDPEELELRVRALLRRSGRVGK